MISCRSTRRLAKFPDDVKRQIIRQSQSQQRDPDVMVVETCAITTRVAPSFTRIGHVDLFSRRAVRAGAGSLEHRELEQMVHHAIFREFSEILQEHPAGGCVQAEMQPTRNSKAPGYNPWKRYKVDVLVSQAFLLSHSTCGATTRRSPAPGRSARCPGAARR
jgi:uncharacterized protein YdiU (UPF0061 family)